MLVALGGLAAANGTRSFNRRRSAAATALAHDTTVTTEQRALGVMRRAVGAANAQTTPPAELRRRVANLASGTYIDDILAQQDSALFRWPEHLRDAMRVYVEPSSDVPGWDPRLPLMVHEVFDEWSAAGFPLRFAFVLDSLDADLALRWRDRFPPEDGQRIGVTERIHSSDFRIVHASIFIALHDSIGRPLAPTTVDGIVRHEVGHALGLNHANDSTSVMFHETATMTISASDRATLRLLYLVPGGSLK
ncbi:MAG: matrixin family metalloprotease [Gemmatimonadaceae bacterium]|nr:matrixin family metalloprotease [Gemmatimonadaceae bacterium]NUO93984.1 matrixin family metalloprotease [Gemmatimonadaceae bacterium]